NDDKSNVNLTSVDPSVRDIQTEKIRRLKGRRDNEEVADALKALSEAAQDESVNLMPMILRCVKAYATLGEISDCMRDVFGEYKAVAIV
ncbi:Methylmalonyl-CoA mutase, partial [Dethiosulfatibacter aminovorans DSM 17477]